MRTYAQTYPQLFNQLRELDDPSVDLDLIRDAYELGMSLFSSRFQPSGKVYMAHLVGTASILASLRSASAVIAAGLLHNAYRAGDFGDGHQRLSPGRREKIREIVGVTVEAYLARFPTLHWRSPEAKLALFEPFRLNGLDRDVLLIRAADHLDHLCDLRTLGCHDHVRETDLGHCRMAARVAESLGFGCLAAELREGIQATETAEPPVDDPRAWLAPRAFVIPPASQRKRFTVKSREVWRDQRHRLGWPIAALGRQLRRAYERRPQGDREVFKSLFSDGERPEKVAGGFQFTEGPVWVPEESSLLFSDIPANRILRLSPNRLVEPYREPSGHSNGLTRDRQGRLISCEHGNRRVSRTERDQSITILADEFQGKRLNSPNDVVVKSDGAIYFTDPACGISTVQQEQPIEGVYRLSPDGKDLSLVATQLARPNGLAFSPNEEVLYIADSAQKRILALKVNDDGLLCEPSLFHVMESRTPGAPDGLKVDTEGRVFCAGPGGIWVLDARGQYLGTIPTPEKPSNCAWGDEDWRTLYITAVSSVYRIRVRTQGVKTA
jgi:gluconolactonase